MNILSIECSCQQGSVSVVRDGHAIQTWEFECPRGRGNSLFANLESALRLPGAPDAVIVGTGPGGYNGLRASISVAWGIARAQGVRLAGVSSLLGYDAAEYFVVGDARAGQWFLAHVEQGFFVAPPLLFSREEAGQLLKPGVPVFSTGELAGFPGAIARAPSAAVLACREFSPGLPVPHYLKPPHITKPAS